MELIIEILPISCFIIAKNEEDRIGKAILSVKDFVEEIIVIDSGSKDDTETVSYTHLTLPTTLTV